MQVGHFAEIPVAITILGDDILVGLDILRHFAVLLDHGERVIVIQ